MSVKESKYSVEFQCIIWIILLVFLIEKTNAVNKNSELTSVFNTHLQGEINLARRKLISYFIIALCKMETVTSEKLPNAYYT